MSGDDLDLDAMPPFVRPIAPMGQEVEPTSIPRAAQRALDDALSDMARARARALASAHNVWVL